MFPLLDVNICTHIEVLPGVLHLWRLRHALRGCMNISRGTPQVMNLMVYYGVLW
jgi:ABC-type amino acid transport system permease subunit